MNAVINAARQRRRTPAPTRPQRVNLKHFRMFEAENYFVLRTPLFPVTRWHATLQACGDGDQDMPDSLRGLWRQWRDPAVREAVFLASPSLHARVVDWNWRLDRAKDLKLALALYNYMARMATRSTPFGLFASVSVGRVADHTALLPAGTSDALKRHTRLDSSVVASLCERLLGVPEIRHRVPLRANETGHRVGRRWHYVEWTLNDGGRSYSLGSVEIDAYLEQVLALCASPRAASAIADELCREDPEIEIDDALEFIDCLIDNHVLVPELQPCLTGSESLPALIDDLDAVAPESESRAALARIVARLDALDAAGIGQSSEAYGAVAGMLEELEIQRPANHLFQVDLYRAGGEFELNASVAGEIAAAAELSMRLGARRDGRLDEFCQRFSRRYEGRRVPLLEALDEESGVGQVFAPGPGSALLDGVAWQPGIASDGDGKVRELLARKWLGGNTEPGEELELSPADVPAWDPEVHGHAAWSSHAMATLMADSHDALVSGDYRIHLRGVLGPSAANMMGRFCHGIPALGDAIRNSLAGEACADPDAVYAEIVHLPRERLGNLVCRPLLRDYEIPLLGRSGAAPDRQIELSDLEVEVRGQTVLLWSRRLGRRVVPRMATAHNYAGDTLGLYRFLCLVQFQGHARGAFHPGLFPPGLRYLPRMRCGHVILSPAVWRLDRAELDELRRASADRRLAAARRLRERHCLPRHAGLRQGDHLLPIDFEHELAIESLCRAARKHGRRLELLEIPGLIDNACIGDGDQVFAHELIVPLRTAVADPARTASESSARAAALHRQFHIVKPSMNVAVDDEFRHRLPGSDWLYLRIHGGPNVLDRLLGDTFMPLAERQRGAGSCANWFFIRYGDPDWHLRLRFHGRPSRLTGEVLPEWQALLARLRAEGQVARVEIGTYEREVERYGGPRAMLLCEHWFDQESRRIAGLLQALRGGNPHWRWQVAAACLMLDLSDLGLDRATLSDLFTCLANGYRAEFRMEKQRMATLGVQYRTHTNAILRACEGRMPSDHSDEKTLLAMVDQDRDRRRAIGQSLRALEDEPGAMHGNTKTLAPSLVHMSCNRWFSEAPRPNEMVLYDMLRRGLTALQRGASIAESGDTDAA